MSVIPLNLFSYRQFYSLVKCKNSFPQKLLDMHGLIPNYVFRYEEIQDNFQAICGS